METSRIKTTLVTLFIGILCAIGVVNPANALPPGFQDQIVLSGLNQPVNLTTLPDGRMLVLQKAGEIRIFNPQVTPATSTIYMTLTNIESGQERGLTSLVLDPDFQSNGHLYIYYTHASSAKNRISRFTHQGNTASVASEVLLWEDNEVWSDCCHYGGGLDFGPDGYLYLSTGEEFDGQQAQDLTRAGGKIIRIRKDGTIPNDNPFVDGPGGNLDEIWALGLRNPYRAKWDTIYNKYFFGDVGGNVQSTAREEVNVGVWGGNFGWPNCEGLCGNPQYIEPIFDYGHTAQTPNGGTVTLGPVYRGNLFPNQYFGNLFIADYALGWIKYLELDNQGNFLQVHDFDDNVNNVVALIQGPEGALYYVDVFGQVRRITYTIGNQPPQVTSADATPVSGPADLSVSFDATAFDFENDPLSYNWIFGDGNESGVSSIPSASHIYTNNGAYTAYVEVSDGTSTTLSSPITIQVGIPPQVNILTPEFGLPFQALDIINFSGLAVDPDGVLIDSDYSWTIRFLHNAHTHPVLDGYVGSAGSFQINDSGHDYFDFTGFELILTVTDSDGLTATDRIEIYPDKVILNFATSPAGQQIVLDGVFQNTPIPYDSMIGFRHTISAPGTFCDVATNTGYEFSSWSDGGTQTHEILVPNTDLDLTANYTATGSCVGLVTPGLVLHLESDQGLVSSGGVVTTWLDQSGMGNDVVASGDPLAIPGTLNGRTVVDFDGVGDKLERILTLNGLPAGNADRTVFVIANYRSTGYGGFAYGTGMGPPSTCNQTFGLIVDPQGQLMVQGWCDDFAATEQGTGAGWMVQSAVLNGGVLSHYKDGQLIDSQIHTYNTVLSNMVLGAELDSVPYLDMQMATVLVYDRALNSAELQQVQSYLQQKYFGVDALAIDTVTLPDATQGSAYSTTLVASGGLSPYGWSIATGSLPQDLFLDAATGVISGTPTIAQTTNFTLTVTDNAGASFTSGALSLTVTDSTGGTPATVLITDPLDGTTIEGPDVLVTYTLAGSGYDHLHLRVDNEPHITITSLTGSYLLTGIASGTHSVSAQLVTSEHAPLGNPEANDTVNIAVTGGGNQPPVAGDDLVAVEVGGFAQVTVLANDSDSDGTLDLTSVSIVSFPLHGTIFDDGTGVLTYTHDGGADTGDSFTYTVMDNEGAVSNEATVSVVIGGIPVASGLVFHLESDSGLGVNGGQVTSWSDLSGSGYTLVSDGDPQLVISPELGNQPVVDFDGTGDKLEIASGLSGLPAGNADRTVYLVANYRGVGYGGFAYGNSACNQAFGPTVDNQGRLMAQGWCGSSDQRSNEIGTGVGWMIQSIVHASGVMSHYKDGVLIDTQSHNYNTVLDNLVLGGELADNNFMDMQVAAVLIYDRALDTTEAQQVEAYLQNKYIFGSGPINWPPVVTDDVASTGVGGSVDIAVLSNDSDVNGNIDPSSVSIVSNPVNGTVLSDGAGLLTYTHDGSLTASDSFTYTVMDTDGAVSNEGLVSMTIIGVNIPPQAEDDLVAVEVGGFAQVTVLANDSDSDGTLDLTSVSIVSFPLHGTIFDDGTGVLTYTHDGGADTGDSFTYTVMDNEGAVSNEATVSVVIGGIPVASGLVFHLESDSGLGVNGGQVTSWSDLSGSGYTLVSDGDPQLVISPELGNQPVVDFDGTGDKLEIASGLSGLPAGNADRTVYLVANYRGVGYGGFAYGNSACNQAFGPTVDNQGRLMAQGWCGSSDQRSNEIGTGVGWMIQSIVHASGVMSHYKDGVLIDTQSHNYNTVLDNLVLGGELADNNFMDMQVAAVLIYDRALDTTEAQQVEAYLQNKYIFGSGPINWPPVVTDDVASTGVGGSVDIAVLSNDSDVNGNIDPSSVSIVSNPVNGTVLSDGAGLLTYTHDGSLTASDSFTYTVMDTDGAVSNEGLVSMTIIGVNIPPQAEDDLVAVEVGGFAQVTVLANDSDSDGTLDLTSVSIVSFPLHGTIFDDGTGVLTYTHDGGADTGDSFTYTVMDNEGAVSNEATVSVVIGGIPVASGLVFHLESDSGLGVNGGQVTSWSDLSGSGYTLVSDGDPQLVISPELGNQPVVDFDGTGDKLEIASGLSGLPAGNADRTVYLVANYRGVGYGGFAYGNSACNQAFGPTVDNQGRLMAQGWCGSSDQRSNEIGTGVGWMIQSIVHASGVMSHYKDGVLIDTQSHNYNTVLDNLVLGGELADNNFMDMQVAAVLIYDRALDTTEAQQVEAYLQNKYSMQ